MLAAVLAATIPATASAQDSLLRMRSSVYLQAAGAERNSTASTVGVTFPWRDWSSSFLGSQVSGYWDLSLSRWASDAGPPNGRMTTTVFEITPSFRFVPDAGQSHFFLDAGVGATVANHRYTVRNKVFSTRFNFASHIGAGWVFGDQRQHEIQLRVQHVSNAGLRHPNPGENFVQLRYSMHF